MRTSIFGLTLALAAFFSTVASAQLDLETIMSDDKQSVTTQKTSENEKPEQPQDLLENSSDETIILPEDETNESTPDIIDTQADSEPSGKNESADSDDFMVQYFNDIDNEAAEEAAAQAARNAATELINDEPVMISLPEEQQKLLKISEKRRQQRAQKRVQELEEQKRIEAEILAQKQAQEEAEAAKDPQISAARKAEAEKKAKEQMLSGHEKAPFGLYWGLSKEETETLGFQFKEAQLDNNQNVYLLLNPQQQQKTFEPVFAVFGNKNRLYSVYAEGIYSQDTPRAEKVLRLYDRYYTALKEKYGNDREHFKPHTHEGPATAPVALRQTAEKSAAFPANPKTVMIEHPRGNDDFLKELQEEKASLYAIFGDKKMQITLTVEVNPDGQSHIVLDYENLEIQQNDNRETIKDLIEEL